MVSASSMRARSRKEKAPWWDSSTTELTVSAVALWPDSSCCVIGDGPPLGEGLRAWLRGTPGSPGTPGAAGGGAPGGAVDPVGLVDGPEGGVDVRVLTDGQCRGH